MITFTLTESAARFDPREITLAEQRAADLRCIPHPSVEEWGEIDAALGREPGSGERQLSERLAAEQAAPSTADVVGMNFQVTPPETEADPSDETAVPAASAPVEEQVAFWRHRATWCASPVRYAQALVVLDRLKLGTGHAFGPAMLGEPANPNVVELARPRPAAPSSPTATVKIRKILNRDLAGDLSRVVEWECSVPMRPDGQPDLSALPPEPPASR